jgi:hypothetical protein
MGKSIVLIKAVNTVFGTDSIKIEIIFNLMVWETALIGRQH